MLSNKVIIDDFVLDTAIPTLGEARIPTLLPYTQFVTENVPLFLDSEFIDELKEIGRASCRERV